MKELKLFESWADTTADNGVLMERGIPGGIETPTRPTNAKTDRRLQQSDSLVRQARRKYPGRDDSEAIARWTADEVAKSRETELQQNKLINAQRRENEKLTSTVAEIGRELEDIQSSESKHDTELNRLRQLAGDIKSGGEARSAEHSEVEALLKDVEELKNKPGMTPEAFIAQKKGDDLIARARLPETLEQQLDSLAENILGDAYAKYLK